MELYISLQKFIKNLKNYVLNVETARNYSKSNKKYEYSFLYKETVLLKFQLQTYKLPPKKLTNNPDCLIYYLSFSKSNGRYSFI